MIVDIDLPKKIEELHGWPLSELIDMERHARKEIVEGCRDDVNPWSARVNRISAEIARRFEVVDAVDHACRKYNLRSV